MLFFIRILILTKLLDQIPFCTADDDKCGQLCDKEYIDAITTLNVYSDTQFIVLVIRDGQCSWLLDITYPEQNKKYGRKHRVKGPAIQSMFTVFDDPKSSKNLNMTALHDSGTSARVWRMVNNRVVSNTITTDPLKGLRHNQKSRIDASYLSQPDSQTKILTIFQNNNYYRFDMNNKTQISGPDSLSKDFSYDYNKYSRLTGSFSRGQDVFLFHMTGYFIWKSSDGKSGQLSELKSVTKDFYRCVTGVPENVRDINDEWNNHLDSFKDINNLTTSSTKFTTSSSSTKTDSSNDKITRHNFKNKQNTQKFTKTVSKTNRPTDREDDEYEPQDKDQENGRPKIQEEDEIEDRNSVIPTRKSWKAAPKVRASSVDSSSIDTNLLSNKLLITLMIVSIFKFNVI